MGELGGLIFLVLLLGFFSSVWWGRLFVGWVYAGVLGVCWGCLLIGLYLLYWVGLLMFGFGLLGLVCAGWQWFGWQVLYVGFEFGCVNCFIVSVYLLFTLVVVWLWCFCWVSVGLFGLRFEVGECLLVLA